MGQRLFKFHLFLFLALIVLSSCQSKEAPSIFVIAVDDLPVTDIQCNEDLLQKNHSGFAELCKNSVRFTHFFTSSVLSLPALTSLLTGYYPFDHKVRNNGDFLEPEILSAPELALQKNYRTSFFSGGPSVLKKSNLHQGFEIFDDHFVVAKDKIHRPFQRSLDLFTEWLESEVGSQPFFSVIYAPDLSLVKKSISTDVNADFGENRATDLNPALDEFDEKLFSLIELLKKQKKWNSIYFVLVGLNGKGYNDRADEFAKINLHSENTQTALFIKVPSKPRDEGLAWKTDTNFSMADLGLTLLKMIDPNYKNPVLSDSSPFKTFHFLDRLKAQTPNVEIAHPIPIETQLQISPIEKRTRYALIKEHMLYIEKDQWESFNTLSDRLETNPVVVEDLAARPSLAPYLAFLSKKRNGPWEHPSALTLRYESLSQNLWIQNKKEAELIAQLKTLLSEAPKNIEIKSWLTRLLFEKRNWAELYQLTKDDATYKSLAYLSQKKLKNPKLTALTDICLQSLEIESFSASDLKRCPEAASQLVLQYKFADQLGLEKDVMAKRLEQLNSQREIDLHIARLNRTLSGVWWLNPSADPALQMFELLQH